MVEGSGFRVQGSGFRVQGSGLRVAGGGQKKVSPASCSTTRASGREIAPRCVAPARERPSALAQPSCSTTGASGSDHGRRWRYNPSGKSS
ncbi:hypothetical protein T484DRAFT_3369387 [Baffinella frigidus]|nr:hypothetical protein T484DRAFT_3369387 [Cryptophyta sp. CCMP2293]